MIDADDDSALVIATDSIGGADGDGVGVDGDRGECEETGG